MKAYIILVAGVLLTGCLSRNVQTVYREIESQRPLLKGMTSSIDALDKKRQEKLKRNELDEKTDSAVANYIRQLKDSIASRLNRYDALSDNKTLRRNKKSALADLNAAKESYKNALENIQFLDDLLDASTFSRLNTTAFFAPGKYLLGDSASGNARTIMGDIIRTAQQFSSKYTSRKLRATFVVTGYADEEDIVPGSELYQSLVAGTSTVSPARQQLNKELSSRRAESIKNILSKEYEVISKSNLSATFLALGKGEEYPGGLITDYKPVDERRRVVLLYWSILPEL